MCSFLDLRTQHTSNASKRLRVGAGMEYVIPLSAQAGAEHRIETLQSEGPYLLVSSCLLAM